MRHIYTLLIWHSLVCQRQKKCSWDVEKTGGDDGHQCRVVLHTMADGANVNVNRRGAGAPNYAESKALDAMELLFCTVSEMEQGALAIYIVGT